MACLQPDQLEPYLKGCGLHRQKSRYLIAACQKIIDEYEGRVPERFEDLVSLPGVGRKLSLIHIYLAQIPFFPGRKANFDLEQIKPSVADFALLYPEVFRCLGCSSCTKVCPQDIDVMQYIAYIQRGDFARAADISFDCVMCGLCVSRCPVHIVHYNAALTARRLYSRYIALPDVYKRQRMRYINILIKAIL